LDEGEQAVLGCLAAMDAFKGVIDQPPESPVKLSPAQRRHFLDRRRAVEALRDELRNAIDRAKRAVARCRPLVNSEVGAREVLDLAEGQWAAWGKALGQPARGGLQPWHAWLALWRCTLDLRHGPGFVGQYKDRVETEFDEARMRLPTTRTQAANCQPEKSAAAEPAGSQHPTTFEQKPWDLREPGYCAYTDRRGRTIRFELEGRNRRFLACLLQRQGKPVSFDTLAEWCGGRAVEDWADRDGVVSTRASRVRGLLKKHLGKGADGWSIDYKDPRAYALLRA
jgi:hypothetical protein